MRLINFLTGLFYLIIGLFMWNNPADTILSYSLIWGMTYIAGALVGLFYCLYHNIRPIPYATIAVSLLFGIFILTMPILSMGMMLWLFVLSFLSLAGYYLYTGIKARGGLLNLLQIALAVIGLLFGVIMIFNPIIGFTTMAKVLAVGVLLNGFSYILYAIKFSGKIN
ncbi:DUF308 domain-containing protein [Streptococcus entericus]|uniref:DUF308 domain-containing protein n=1 Tax=Streptococcus entericus TaxID=155680 RepID=UPI000363D5E8|nr:DUF308 domain-containing protein [Streptococcus entericus]